MNMIENYMTGFVKIYKIMKVFSEKNRGYAIAYKL